MAEESQVAGFITDEFSYENVWGECSACERKIVLNRATHIGNALPAVGRHTRCPACDTTLYIYGDTADHPIMLLLDEITFLKREKRYMYCALVLSQALEMTLWLCAETVLAYEPVRS